MHVLTIRLFGTFEACDHRGNALSLGSKRTQSALIYLALHLDQGGSASELGSLFFNDRNSHHVTEVLNDLRYALRFASGDVLITEGDSIRLNPAIVDVDTSRFERVVTLPSVTSTRQATDIYRGNLLNNFTADMPAFDAHIAERRLYFWRSAVGVFGRLLNAQIKAGWWEAAVDTASRLLALDPTQEVVHRTLMRLQLEQGRADSALRRYQECSDILRREYGRAPSEETERLRHEIVAELDRTPAPREAFRDQVNGPTLVLLLEDDLVSSALVEGFLTESGYEVVAVGDGGDALLEIGRREFDLLILDINVPTLSGLRLFEIMLQKGIDTPAIFITGAAGAEAEARSLEMGAADFLRKPIRKEVLLPRVRTILQRKTRSSTRSRFQS
jgi:CheY-like chemotaxis protein